MKGGETEVSRINLATRREPRDELPLPLSQNQTKSRNLPSYLPSISSPNNKSEVSELILDVCFLVQVVKDFSRVKMTLPIR